MNRAWALVAGVPVALPAALVARFPELARARYRRGGLFPRIGGWCLGTASVAGITLWRTIWFGADTQVTLELLLHEVRHVQQFEDSATFPLRYVWEFIRRGYQANRFEVDARRYAAERLRSDGPPPISHPEEH